MSRIKLIYARLLGLVRRDHIEREMEEELRFHLRMRERENIRAGMSAAEAGPAAARRFGNLDRIKEACRDIKGGGLMETILQDLRYGARLLLNKPSFTVVAILALALGIGANTAVFSVVNAVLLRPLPYAQPDRLVTIWGEFPELNLVQLPACYPDLRDWIEQNHVFEGIAAYRNTGYNLTGAGEPEHVSGMRVTANLFSVLGARAGVGRTFAAEEDRKGAPNVAILAYSLWQRRFQSDPGIIGKVLTLNDQNYTVVGVMPRGFRFPVGFSYLGKLDFTPIEIWLPLIPDETLELRGNLGLFALGRLKDGVSIAQARAEMSTIASRLGEQYPDSNKGLEISLLPTHEEIIKDVRPALLVLLGAVVFVLLIACANVANLLLARASARRKEIAIRLALGASRWRIARQLLTESLLLALLGAAVGLALALWGTRALVAVGAQSIPRADEINIDFRVLGFTLAIGLFTGLLFGLLPALHASKPDLNGALKEGAKGSSGGAGMRMRSGLVMVEVALSLVLLACAGLLIKSFVRLQEVNPGFNPEHVLATSINLSQARYSSDAQRTAFFKQALERIGALPGVQAVSATTLLPMSGNYSFTDFFIEGRPAPPTAAEDQLAVTPRISPRFFNAMQIALRQGREFTEQDNVDGPGAAIISENLARAYFPNEDPIGKRVSIGDSKTGPWLAIVGVVADVKQTGLEEAGKPALYLSFLQSPDSSLTVVARTATTPLNLSAAVREQVLAIDPQQPVARFSTMDQLLDESSARQHFNMLLLGILSAAALILAAIGIYGVMSYMMAERTHEIGIRMALGASPLDTARLALGQGARLIGGGVAAGLIGAFGLTRFIASLLFGVSVTDPVIFVAIPVVLTGVALAACWAPARRAMKVDPIVALRQE